jgi:phage terminase large subunit GpA-like protein
VKGYPKREWQKTRDRNEALDCRVYARAAAIALGVDRWSESKWEHLAGKSDGFVKKEPEGSVNSPPGKGVAIGAPTTRPRIVRSSMM